MIKKLVILLAFFSVSMSVFATRVNINTADAKTIADSLSGIGLKKAEAIIDYRTKNGAFKSVDDLTQVSGIGTKTIEKNKADILLIDSNTPTPVPSSEPITTESVDKADKTVKKKK